MKNKLDEIAIECIKDYVSKIVNANRLLAFEFAKEGNRTQSVIMLYKETKIPSKGEIGGVKFFFHGLGCSLDYEDYSIDFDYGPCGIVGGVDMYKLLSFIQSVKYTDTYKPIAFEEVLKSSISRMCEKGIIFRDDSSLSSIMYYLK